MSGEQLDKEQLGSEPVNGGPGREPVNGGPGRAEAERAMRALLREHDLPEPDQILDHDEGGIVCLWHEPKVAIVVDLED